MAALAAWIQVAACFSLVSAALVQLLGSSSTVLMDISWAAWVASAMMACAEAVRFTRARVWVSRVQTILFSAVFVALQLEATTTLDRICIQCAQVAAGISILEGIARTWSEWA